MAFNENKFECITFSNKNTLHIDTTYIGPQGKHIEKKTEITDLGITVSEDASFTNHSDKIVAKCRQLMGYILRTFLSREPVAMLTLWKAIISCFLFEV